ncbi:hypothetical protein ACWCXH_00305 [Kitasatospora sp. NPDC001660]
MLSRIAGTLLPVLGCLSVTSEPAGSVTPGSIAVANHGSRAAGRIVLSRLPDGVLVRRLRGLVFRRWMTMLF